MTNEDLTSEQQQEIWLLACQLGIDVGRARAEWERRKAQNKPKPQPEPETEEEVEPEETEEETSIEEETAQLKLENEKRKSLIISEIWDKLQAEEEAQESAQLPENLQAEYKKTVDEAVKRVNIQLEAHQKQVLQNLEKYALEAQKKIDEHLQFSLKVIDSWLINAKPTDQVRQFIDILLKMKKDPQNNIDWVIRLFNTGDGIIMTKGNNTDEEKGIQEVKTEG